MNQEDLKRVNEAIKKALQGYLDSDGSFNLDIADLNLKIYLQGPKWTGRVDRPVAQFLLDLDKRLNEELENLGVELPESQHGLVALRIESGSLQAFLEYAPQVYEHIQALAGPQKVAIFATVLTSFGLLRTVRSHLKNSNEDAEVVDTEVHQARSREIMLDRLEASAPQLQQPLKKLIGAMDKGDAIILPGESSPIKKEDAKKVLDIVKPEAPKANSYYIDQHYIIENLETKPDKVWRISLRYGDLSFKAKLLIRQEEISDLLARYREAHAQGRSISADLQVVAEIDSKGVKSTTAAVVGVGKPRPKSAKLSEALERESKRQRKIQ